MSPREPRPLKQLSHPGPFACVSLVGSGHMDIIEQCFQKAHESVSALPFGQRLIMVEG